MKIIDNINTNHNFGIQKLILNSTHIIIVSPFLMPDFDEFIFSIAQLGVKKITLVTTLKDGTSDLLSKADSLRSLFFACQANHVEYEIRVDNKLHGKIYVALEGGKPKQGIITSANLTSNGLRHNHEWGIELDDSDALQKVIDDVFSVSTTPLSLKELNDIYTAVDKYRLDNPQEKAEKLEIKVSHIYKRKVPVQAVNVTTAQHVEFPPDTKFFIKPLGSKNSPFPVDRVLNVDTQEIQFSRRRPNDVGVGDILICYGVGVRKLLGYFKVTSEPYEIHDTLAQWPWRVETVNLCPKYSSEWWKYNNILSEVAEAYGSDKELTYIGGKSLGGLNYGHDKIRLNESFAQHLINVIEQSLKQLEV